MVFRLDAGLPRSLSTVACIAVKLGYLQKGNSQRSTITESSTFFLEALRVDFNLPGCVDAATASHQSVFATLSEMKAQVLQSKASGG